MSRFDDLLGKTLFGFSVGGKADFAIAVVNPLDSYGRVLKGELFYPREVFFTSTSKEFIDALMKEYRTFASVFQQPRIIHIDLDEVFDESRKVLTEGNDLNKALVFMKLVILRSIVIEGRVHAHTVELTAPDERTLYELGVTSHKYKKPSEMHEKLTSLLSLVHRRVGEE